MVDIVLLAGVTLCCIGSLYDLRRYHSFEAKGLNASFWRGTIVIAVGIAIAVLKWAGDIGDAWSRVSELENVWIESVLFIVVAFDGTFLVSLGVAYIVIFFMQLMKLILGSRPKEAQPDSEESESV